MKTAWQIYIFYFEVNVDSSTNQTLIKHCFISLPATPEEADDAVVPLAAADGVSVDGAAVVTALYAEVAVDCIVGADAGGATVVNLVVVVPALCVVGTDDDNIVADQNSKFLVE